MTGQSEDSKKPKTKAHREADLGKMGEGAGEMFSGIVGPGVGLYLTIIIGVMLIGFGLKVAVSGSKAGS